MVQEACTYVDKTPNLETQLKLIDTLRTVTDGKVSSAAQQIIMCGTIFVQCKDIFPQRNYPLFTILPKVIYKVLCLFYC